MKIAIIGAGAMGSALAEGLLKGSVFKPENIVIANPHQEKIKKFAQLGVQTTTDNCAAVKGAQLVAIVVKPWLVEQVINEIKGVTSSRLLLIWPPLLAATRYFRGLKKMAKGLHFFRLFPILLLLTRLQ